METVHEEGIDTLASLEQRVQRAVELLTSLRGENQGLNEQLSAARSERDERQTELDEVHTRLSSAEEQIKSLSEELETLRSERQQVKSRIEKLLGKMYLLSAS
jgi:chromosome segregation ATPase